MLDYIADQCYAFCEMLFELSSMKTSLFKWKPDLEGAAVEYGKAGKSHVKCFIVFTLLLAYCHEVR
jgi:hypothetical protein